MALPLEKAILWKENSYFSQKQWFEVQNVSIIDLFLTNTQLFPSKDVNWWTGVVWVTCGLLWCFYQLFGLSFWRHPFTAEHPLVSKWCNATYLQISKTNSSTSWIAWGRVNFHFYFWMNYSFNVVVIVVSVERGKHVLCGLCDFFVHILDPKYESDSLRSSSRFLFCSDSVTQKQTQRGEAWEEFPRLGTNLPL